LRENPLPRKTTLVLINPRKNLKREGQSFKYKEDRPCQKERVRDNIKEKEKYNHKDSFKGNKTKNV